jgi:superfamily I DNA/RNA helicase
MVDEYQDTNALQSEIVRLLAAPHANVMVVGDDAQSIYAFRGADFRNILDFPKLFPGTRVITLDQNYRSTQSILDLANEIINRRREYTKNLFSARDRARRRPRAGAHRARAVALRRAAHPRAPRGGRAARRRSRCSSGRASTPSTSSSSSAGATSRS